jgi:hypothetical protein
LNKESAVRYSVGRVGGFYRKWERIQKTRYKNYEKKNYIILRSVGYSVQWKILTNYTDAPFKKAPELFLVLASTRPHSPT